MARHREGAEILAWPGADRGPLLAAGVPVRSVEDGIGEEGRAALEATERRWARLWGRVPLLDGKSFRELVTWRDTSLLWMSEAYIRGETAGPRCARLAETALRMLEAVGRDEVEAVGLGGPDTILLARACTARGVLFHGSTPAGRALPPRSRSRRRRWRGLRAIFAPQSPTAPPVASAGSPGVPPLLVLAGPRTGGADLEPVAAAAARELHRPVILVGSAELTRWETRRVRRAVAEATSQLREHRSRLRGAPGLDESYAHRGVRFADLAGSDLDSILLGRLPDAVRLLETAVELLAASRTAVVLLVGWPRDDRRSLLAAAAAGRVPTVVPRAGNRDRDDVDRSDGGPQATATAEWEPGSDPAPLVARLAEAARVTVGPA